MDNPLLHDATLPAFLAIRPEHIEPAIRQVLEENRRSLQELLESGAEGWDLSLIHISEPTRPY